VGRGRGRSGPGSGSKIDETFRPGSASLMQSQIALRAWGFATALGGGQPEPGPPTRPPLGHERRALRGLVASARRGLVHCPGRGRIRSRETRRSPRIRSRARIRFVHERGCVTLGPARGRANSRTTTTPPDIREKPGCRTGRIDSFRDTNGCGPRKDRRLERPGARGSATRVVQRGGRRSAIWARSGSVRTLHHGDW